MDDNLDKKSSPPSVQKPRKESVSYTKNSNQGTIGSMADRLRGVFSNKTTAILAVIILVVGLGAATIAVQRSTETRQHAATILPQGPCYPLGDTNLDGKVDNVDALLILRFVSGLSITGTFIQSNGDVNRDGKTDSVDSLLIQRYITGLDTTFTGCATLTPSPTNTPVATPTPTKAPTPTPTKTLTLTPTPTPAPKYVTIKVFIDNNSNGILEAGEAFGTPNVNFSPSIATIDQSSNFGALALTLLINTSGVVGPMQVPGSNYKYHVTPGAGWQITKYSSDKNLSGTPLCNANTSCDYSSGWTGTYSPAAGETVTFFLGLKKISATITPNPTAIPTPTTAPPTPTPATGLSPQGPCYPLGDVNVDGKVDSVDALLILRYVAALPITGTFNQQNGDVNRDGKTDSVDALLIQRYITGLDTTFTGCTTSTPTTSPVNTADINRDGIVDLLDFNLWLRAAQEIDSPPYTAGGKAYYPDVNNSGGIPDLIDFNMWLAAYRNK